MAKKPKKPRVPRTRNAGTMTESAFWSMIRSALRQKSRWWKPISECKTLARRAYKGKNKRQKNNSDKHYMYLTISGQGYKSFSAILLISE